MGKRLIIPGVNTFAGPKIYADPILSSGSLLLWDPTHPAGGDAGGVVNGTILSNIAADIAAEILGITESEARPTIINTAGANSVQAVKQRSGKGGLAGIYSKAQPVGDTSGNNNLGVRAQYLRNYMFSNRLTNSFFVSVWVRSLRSGRRGSQNAPQALMYFSASVGATTNFLYVPSGGNSPGANNLGQRNVGASSYQSLWDVDAPRILNVAMSRANGWETGDVKGSLYPTFTTGSVDAWGGSNQPGPSGVIERAYIEDLTVSGRTYAEVDAIDFALFTAAHASGGAWFGDTYPNPSILP